MKRKFKRIASLVLAVVMVFAMAMPAMADSKAGGSITITSSPTVPVKDKTFKAYKILDVTVNEGGTSYAYTVPKYMMSFFAGHADFSGLNQSAANYGQLVADVIAGHESNSDWLESFAKAALAAAKAANATAYTSEPAGENVKIDVPEYGYYVVEDTDTGADGNVVSALMLDTVAPNKEITIKANTPSIDKKIDEGKNTAVGEGGKGLVNTGDDVESDQKEIGDTVNYVIEGTVPDMKGYETYKYEITDTVTDGLNINTDGLEVYVGEKKLAEPDDYTITWTKRTSDDPEVAGTVSGFVITFKHFIGYQDQTGDQILVKYSAVLNKNAELGTTGNDNTAELTYSNNPNNSGAGEPGEPKEDNPTGKPPGATTRTFTSGIKLKKVDNEHNPLTGAKFSIKGTAMSHVLIEGDEYVEKTAEDTGKAYYKLTDGTYTDTAPTDATRDQYADEKEYVLKHYSELKAGTPEEFEAEAYVNEEGILEFKGLDAGTYTITELEAPDGYNMLEKPIEVVIRFTDDAEKYEDTVTWEATKDGVKIETTEDGMFTFDVVNEAGALLPETGGIGTTIFYVVGSVLVLGAVVLLVTKRRMKSE